MFHDQVDDSVFLGNIVWCPISILAMFNSFIQRRHVVQVGLLQSYANLDRD